MEIRTTVKKLFNKIKHLELIKVFSFTAMSTFVRMITGFVSVKVISVLIGPMGVALQGQLSNFSAMIMTFANGGITSGITRNIAANREDRENIKSYVGTAVKFTLIISSICGIFLILFSNILSEKILDDNQYRYVFVIFGVTIIFYSLNVLLLAILNGFKEFRTYVKISMISSIVGLLISLCLVYFLHVDGALINTVTNQTFVFIVTVFMLKIKKYEFFSKDYLFAKFEKDKLFFLLRFSLMTFVAQFLTPLTSFFIRTTIISFVSMTAAGCWEGLNRLSNIYLMIITQSFSVYYMPRLAEIKDQNELRHEILISYKIIIPCLCIGFPLIFVFKKFLVNLLFSKEFLSMTDLFFWQLCGDFFKIVGWILAYCMSAKAMMKEFIITEIITNVGYMLLAYLFIVLLNTGAKGAVMAYTVNNIIYFIMMYFIIWRRICQRKKC